MKVLYLEENDPYNEYSDDSDIKMSEILELDDSQLLNLLNEILGVISHINRKNAKKLAIESIKRVTGLVAPEQVKVLDGLKVKGNTLLFPLGGFGYENIEVGKDDSITDYTIEKIVKMPIETACYIQVEILKNIQDKIDAYKVKLEKEKKNKEAKKKERELAKARKILEKAWERGGHEL